MMLKTKLKGKEADLARSEEQKMLLTTLWLGLTCLLVWLVMSVVI